MSCHITDDLIYEYLDGESEPLTALILKEHISACEACRVKSVSFMELHQALDALTEKIDLPMELDSICNMVLEQGQSSIKPFTLWDYIRIQKSVMTASFRFIQYLTPRRLRSADMGRLGKYSAKILGRGAVKASGFLLRQGYKRALSRSAV